MSPAASARVAALCFGPSAPFAKILLARVTTFCVLAVATGVGAPTPGSVAGALPLGAVSYGLSLLLFIPAMQGLRPLEPVPASRSRRSLVPPRECSSWESRYRSRSASPVP